MKEVRKIHNQDLRADLAWNVNCGKYNPNPEIFLAPGA